MSIEELELNDCAALSFSDWLQNDQVVKFQNEVEERLFRFLFSSDPNDPQFFQTIQSLATVGATPSERALLERDILALNELEAVPCGLFRNIGRASAKIARFIANHKKEIFVGAGLCATGLGIAAVTGYACTAVIGGVAVAGAGSIFSKKEEHKKQPNIPNPASKQEIALANTSPFPALPKLELPSTPNEFLVTSEGIWANGEFYSTPDLMEKPHVKETLNQWAISYEKPLQLDPSTLTAYDDPTQRTPLEKFLGQSQLPTLETERRPLDEKSHPIETCFGGPTPSAPTDNYGYSAFPDLEAMKQQMRAEFREYGCFPEDCLVTDDVQPERSKAFSVVGIYESR